MRHFSSTPRALIAMLALAVISAGCSQMRSGTTGDSSATPMSGSAGATSGSSGSSGSSGMTGASGSSSTDPAQGGTGTGSTMSDPSGVRNNSGKTPGSTPKTSLPTGDGSR